VNDNDWKILYTLYRTPNITRAAGQLFMSQSALTKRLQAIEKEWGVPLAQRGKNGISFTPEGDYLARSAGEMLEKLRSLRDGMANVSAGQSGTIRMGVNNHYGRYLLPGMMQSYSALYPNVSFDVRKMMSNEIADAVTAKELQMGIISGEPEFNGVRRLISVDGAYAISKQPITLRQLVNLPRVVQPLAPESAKFYSSWWDEWFASPPLIGVQVNQSSSCYELVSNGYGYSIVLIPNRALESVKLCKLPLFHKDGRQLTRNSWAICREETYGYPLIREWISFLEESSAL